MIECLRILFFHFISPQAMQRMYHLTAPSIKTLNHYLNFNHFGPDSMMYRKMRAFKRWVFGQNKDLKLETSKAPLIGITIDSNMDDIDDKLEASNRINMSSLNTYDLFKIVSTCAMFVDHYGYFGLPPLSWTQRHQTRIFGRFAAPGFFFLAGFSSKRFRIKTWFAALFIYVFVTVLPLGITHSPWESIMNILLINAIFYYIPPHSIQNPLVHFAVFFVLRKYRDYWSADLNIGYGTIPFILSIVGDLMKHKHCLAIIWLVAGMRVYALSSIQIFASSDEDNAWIIGECVVNGIMMMLFCIKEVPCLNHLAVTRFVRDGLKWISRNGLLIYCGHLSMFKLIQLTNYNGTFNYIFNDSDDQDLFFSFGM